MGSKVQTQLFVPSLESKGTQSEIRPQRNDKKPEAGRATCPSCNAPVGAYPFCPRDGELVSGPFVIGERYRVEECLGVGGNAVVFGARHLILGKPVAIKIMKPDWMNDDQRAERFLREARLASQLNHDNIVTVIDFGCDTTINLTYLVMDRLFGVTLADYITKHAPIAWQQLLPILIQLVRALTGAHQLGITHRDLNPRNIMLVNASGRSNVVKLCDFGLSRHIEGSDRLTAIGAMVGTPAYVAPEQIRGDATQDHRVDLYSFGVTAYEALTGALPYTANTNVALLARKLNEEAPPISSAHPTVAIPPALTNIVERCLRRDSQKRPHSAKEIESALLALNSGKTSAAQTGDLLGQQIGNYRVEERIGAGGMGSVYRAVHPLIGTQVAIKVLLPELAQVKEVVDRFVQEARAASAIGSPHIPRYVDFGYLPDGRAFATMEFLEGETLAKRLSREGPLPLPLATTVTLHKLQKHSPKPTTRESFIAISNRTTFFSLKIQAERFKSR